ncbi:MAG: hypothetical protein ACLFUK_11240 [Halanaerobium sp.]
MSVKAVDKDDEILCKDCAQGSHYHLDGRGIKNLKGRVPID